MRTTLILNNKEIEHKIRRMAYQVYEHNIDEQEIILAGIMSAGYELAKRIEKILTEISNIKVILCEISMDKKSPLSGIKCSLNQDAYKDKVVVLADDVLNSGSTLMYGVRHFLEVPLKKLQTLVLVDRSHKKFPVKADFRGIYLSTSLNEMVSVSFGEESKVELF